MLVVDEWIETGAQVLAATKLVERAGGRVVGVACIYADDAEGPRNLTSSYALVSLWGCRVRYETSIRTIHLETRLNQVADRAAAGRVRSGMAPARLRQET